MRFGNLAQALRVVARFYVRQADTQFNDKQFGRFTVRYIPQHEEYVDGTGALLLEAEKKYASAGVPIKDNILVALYGRGTAHAQAVYHMGSSPPSIQVSPKAYQDLNLVHTLIHELAHYYHDKVVPGSGQNHTILMKFMWAVRQRRTQEGGARDVLNRKLDGLNKKYLELQEAKYVRKALPRKGQVFEFDKWLNGAQYHLKGRIVGKSGRFVRVEIVDGPPEYIERERRMMPRSPPGTPLVIQETVDSLTYAGVDEAKAKELAEVEAARHQVYEELQATKDRTDDRYEVQLHDWVPTTYSRKNQFEWFAELLTTHVLGHLKPAPTEWLMSVIKTGKGPEPEPAV